MRWEDVAAVRALRGVTLRGVILGLDRGALAVALLVLVLIVPYLHELGFISTTALNQLGRYTCLAIAAVGLDLVWGCTGILSLCQAMFFTFGGYMIGMHLCMRGPMDPVTGTVPMSLFVVSSNDQGVSLPLFWEPFGSLWFALLMVIAVPGVIAFLFGWFAFRSRVRGVYFSIITQAVTIAAFLLLCRNDLRLCGTNGLTNFTYFLGVDVRTDGGRLALYQISAFALAGAVVFGLWLMRTRFGRILLAVRDSESRLRFAGYNPVAYKAAIFTIGAVLGGIGGALYVPQTGIVTPTDLSAEKSVFIVVWVALGGRGTITGPVLGTFLIMYLHSLLTTQYTLPIETWPTGTQWIGRFAMEVPKNWMLVMGLLAVLSVLFLPRGLVGEWRRLVARFRTSP